MLDQWNWLTIKLTVSEIFGEQAVKEQFYIHWKSERHSVMSDSLWPHGLIQARILEWVAYLPNPGIELGSPALQADSLPTELWGKPPYPLKAHVIFFY